MYRRFLFLFLFFSPLNILCSVAVAASNEKIVSYSFGVVPQFEQRKIFQIWVPILSELEKRTGFRFELKGSSKIPAFEERFMAGGFDLAYMNPYHLVLASDGQGYVPLVKDGRRTLNGILVVRRDSGILNINELQDKAIAFPAPNALGASLLIRAELKNKFGLDFSPKYVQTHSSVYLHVIKKLVDVGGGVMQTLESQKPDIKDNLRVLYKTMSMSPHPIAVHPRVPVAHQDKIRRALLEIASDNNGKQLFSKIPMEYAVTASISDYEYISSLGLGKFYVHH